MSHSIRARRSEVALLVERLLGACSADRRPAATGWSSLPIAFVWLFQTLSRGASLDERFRDARRWFLELVPGRRIGATYQGFVKALRRSSLLPEWIAAAFRERLREWSGADWRVAGWVPLAMDGTRFECPRSRSCQKKIGVASRAKSAPQLVLVSLWHLGVHAWFDFRIAAALVGERALMKDMLSTLPERTLLVGDAGFIGYDFCEELDRRGVAFLLRVGASTTLLSDLGRRASVGGGGVHLWPGKRHRRRPLALRLLVVGSGKKKVHLATNLLDPLALSKKQAAAFYRQRWGIETAYRSMKQTLGRRTLKSRAADLAQLELAGTALGHWALALLALKARGKAFATRGWSTAKAADSLRTALTQPISRLAWRTAWRATLLPPIKRRGRKKRRQEWAKVNHRPPCGAPIVRPANHTELVAFQRLAHTASPQSS